MGVVTSIMGYASMVLSFVFELFLEVGGYAFACLSLSCGLFTGCVSRISSEVLRPATEWKGSEAKRLGPCGACCACGIVVMSIMLCTALLGFSITFAWYESELLVEEIEDAAA